jgi:STE24 endopeptidase
VIDFSAWLMRYAGGAGISILVISMTIGVLALIVRNTKRYMIYIPAAFFILSLSISLLYPRVITPLFYKTSGITDEALGEKIDSLLNKAGLRTKNIFILNKSEYEVSANAYLVGTGTERKIYLYDTLLKKFSHDEILSILAHEISHYREEHMLIGILLGTLSMLLVIPLFNIFSKFLFGRDIKEMTDSANHPSLVICLIMIIFLSNPFENAVSRFMERRADKYSLELTGKPEVFITMKVQLARVNRSYLLPHPVYSWFYGSHPTIIERIKMAEDFGNK